MPTENKTATSCVNTCGDPLVIGANSSTSTGTYGQCVLNDKMYIGDSIPQIQTVASPGIISGTTSINTYGYNSAVNIGTVATSFRKNIRYAKEGEVYIDSESADAYIYFEDSGGWLPCEIESVKKEIGEDGKVVKTISISMSCSVAEMKKRESERKVLTEKYNPKPIVFQTIFSGTSITYTAPYTITLDNGWLNAGGNNIAIGINDNYTTTASPVIGQSYYGIDTSGSGYMNVVTSTDTTTNGIIRTKLI